MTHHHHRSVGRFTARVAFFLHVVFVFFSLLPLLLVVLRVYSLCIVLPISRREEEEEEEEEEKENE